MIKILILSCGANATYHFIKVLREKFPFDFYIIGADINPRYLVPSANLVDLFYQVPRQNEPHYYESILEICKDECVNVILPLFDADQQLFYPQNLDLQNNHILSLGTPKETLSIYQNKNAMFECLAKNHFEIPRIYTQITPDSNKYFAKPKDGFGSFGAKILSGAEICDHKSRNNLIIQEICYAPEITLECFYFQGNISSIARERIEVKSGVCTKARIFYDNELESIALDFARLLKTPLYFNLQFMKNINDKFVITDINLRFAAGMSLSYASGWDAVSAIAKVLLGFDESAIFSTLQSNKSESFVVRAYSDIVTTNGVVAFDLDGTLLNSANRHKIVLDDILRKFGLEINTADLFESKRSGKNTYSFLLDKGIAPNIAKKIHSIWIKNIECDKYLAFDSLYPNALNMLNQYAKNHNLILITARSRKTATLNQLKALNIDKYFKNIYIVSAKSNIAQEKAKYLKLENANLMIGDSEVDFEASKIANVAFRFVKSGFRSAEFMRDFMAKYNATTMGGGKSLLKNSNFIKSPFNHAPSASVA